MRNGRTFAFVLPRRRVVIRLVPSLVWMLICPIAAQRTTDVPKADVQKTAELLLPRARSLSDIRADNAQPFRLNATFSFTGKDFNLVSGTYSEIWFSNSKWRREIVVNDLHRVEVGSPNRVWRLDNSKNFTDVAARITRLTNPFSSTRSLQFGSIQDGTNSQMTGKCVITAPGLFGQKGALCFDNEKGVLVERADPETHAKNAVIYSCFYREFHEFAKFLFPREMACFEDAHHKLDARVTNLSPVDSADGSAFLPPVGAKELGNCQGKSINPAFVYHTAPIFPREMSENSSVELSFVIDGKGKPQDITVAQSGGEAFDRNAVAAVRQWRFKPATCDGLSMPLEINTILKFVR